MAGRSITITGWVRPGLNMGCLKGGGPGQLDLINIIIMTWSLSWWSWTLLGRPGETWRKLPSPSPCCLLSSAVKICVDCRLHLIVMFFTHYTLLSPVVGVTAAVSSSEKSLSSRSQLAEREMRETSLQTSLQLAALLSTLLFFLYLIWSIIRIITPIDLLTSLGG